MSEEPLSADARVVRLAQELCERRRRGESPTIEEYAARHPELAAEIRELFPMLSMLEDLGPVRPEPSSGGATPNAGLLKRLGEYRIIREIGRGGMGVVYEAEQETLKRRVAIKVLPFQTLQDPHQLSRFRVEAQASARLHHTNIVPVFGVGEEHGVHYYVMQFIRGQTLAEVLREVRRLRAGDAGAPVEADEPVAMSVARSLLGSGFEMEPAPSVEHDSHASNGSGGWRAATAEAISGDSTTSIGKDPRGVYCRSVARLALQAAEGLAYAHNEGILHRDIKPSNLLLDLKGTVWITDFGLAKVQDSVELTATGGLVGTIRYMAPERFKGKGDARCDVYGLGVTLYELLTLRPAFPSNDRAEVLRQLTESQPPSPRRIEPSIPRDLETIVLKAIARDPTDRYASAAALAEDLRRFLSFEPVSARRASATERLWRWCQRKPALAAVSGLSALLLVALVAGGIMYAARLGAERNRAAERLVYSKLQEGRAWRLSREPGRRQRSLEALREAVTPATVREVRNEVVGCLALVELRESARRAAPTWIWTIDPELEREAHLEEDGSIRVYAGVGSPELTATLTGDSRSVTYLRLSPGGRFVAICHEYAAWVLWDVDRRERLFECQARGDPPASCFDSRASRFLHVAPDGNLLIRKLPGGEVMRQLEAGYRPHDQAFDPTGRRVAAAGCGPAQNTVNIYDVATGALLRRLFHPSSAWTLAWHPDGQRIAVGCNDYNVYVWEVESGARLLALQGHVAEAVRVFFGAGGEILASAGWDNRTILWHAGTGTQLTEAPGTAVAFSMSGRRLGFQWSEGHGGLGEWRIEGADAWRVLHAPVTGKGPTEIALSPDGRWLAAACVDRGLRVWSLDAPGDFQEANAGTVMSVSFHPDGSALWTGTFEGLYRWPLQSVAKASAWTLGPPQKLVSGAARSVTLARDGRCAAMSLGNGELVLRDLEAGGSVLRTFAHPAASACELSPSGRWLVSWTFQGEDVRVWDAGTGALERSIPSGTARAKFSPDERCLAVMNGQQLTVHEVGSWEERFRAPRVGAGNLAGCLSFSRDGSLLAFTRSRTLISLLRSGDGEELTHFEAPSNRAQVNDLSFSPDDRRLVAAVSQAVHLWDLNLIRRELRARGLDWHPEEPLGEPPTTRPPRLQLDSGGLPPGKPYDFRGSELTQLLDIHSQRLLKEPTPDAFLARAATLERLADWAAVLADADQALKGSPTDPQALTIRATALERLGKRDEALRECERIVSLCCTPASTSAVEHRRACPCYRRLLRVRARSQGGLGPEGLLGAMRDWVELLALEPEDREARESLPWLLVLKRCDASAVAPDVPPETVTLALACAERNHRDSPQDAVFLRDLGALFYHSDRLDEAEPLLREAWRMNPRLLSAAFHLAMVLHRRGEVGQARSAFQSASQAAQMNPPPAGPAREALVRIQTFAEQALEAEAPAHQAHGDE